MYDFAKGGAFYGLNPYFIGLPILIAYSATFFLMICGRSQSLFYWITYSYSWNGFGIILKREYCLNPYFIGLPILIAQIYP